MLTIELRRAIAPDEIGESNCALCGESFRGEAVYAFATNGAMMIDDYEQAACPECVAYFGRRNPERFPTIEEYEEAGRRHPEPILASVEEACRREIEGTFGAVFAASELARQRS